MPCYPYSDCGDLNNRGNGQKCPVVGRTPAHSCERVALMRFPFLTPYFLDAFNELEAIFPDANRPDPKKRLDAVFDFAGGFP